MRYKKQFYENAFNIISVELPNIEGLLKETQFRPMFGEGLEEHLLATNRTIAFPIVLAVSFLRQTNLDDEGLFRISTKQIKLDKLKAYLDAGLEFIPLLQDCDCHFYAAFLKSYLRELPVPLLGRKQDTVYDRWIRVSELETHEAQIREIRYILKEELPSNVVLNIQYMFKFLSKLTAKCKLNKMTPGNLGIVLGPTLLRRCSVASSVLEQCNIERVIKVIAIIVENYNEIFPVDISWKQYDEDMDKIIAAVKELPEDDGWGFSTKSSPTVKKATSNVSILPVPEPRTSLDSKKTPNVASTSPLPEPRRSRDRSPTASERESGNTGLTRYKSMKNKVMSKFHNALDSFDRTDAHCASNDVNTLVKIHPENKSC